MQSSKIDFGKEYAAAVGGDGIQIVTVLEQHTIRNSRNGNAVNKFKVMYGPVDPETGTRKVATIEASAFRNGSEEYVAARKRKEEEDAITQARKEAKEAKVNSAVERFAKALGVHGIHKTSYNDYRNNEPNVRSRYSNIEISPEAVDHLIAFLDRIGA